MEVVFDISAFRETYCHAVVATSRTSPTSFVLRCLSDQIWTRQLGSRQDCIDKLKQVID